VCVCEFKKKISEPP